MIDLTQIGSQRPQPAQPKQSQPIRPTGELLDVPQTAGAEAHRQTHWTPDKFVSDGQITAGEPDEQYNELIKNTEWAE